VPEDHRDPAQETDHRDHEQRCAILYQRIQRGFDRPALDKHGQ
jgi:hypothetical protein